MYDDYPKIATHWHRCM